LLFVVTSVDFQTLGVIMHLGREAARSISDATNENECHRVAIHCSWLHNGSCSRCCPTGICAYLWKYARGKISTCNFM